MNDLIEELNYLGLDSLDEEWVENVYYSEFLEFGDIPSSYNSILETIDIYSIFKGIIKSFQKWFNLESISHEEKTWTVLSQHVKHKKLLALIGYYIDNGCTNILNKEYRDMAIIASRLYYKLLSLPGYKAYHVYHSQIFVHSLRCLGFPKLICENEQNYFNTKELTHEINTIIQQLQHFVLDLKNIINLLQLKSTDINYEDILSNLVDVTGSVIVCKFNIDKIELAKISKEIYEMIDIIILCNTKGECNPSAVHLLFKGLLPKLVAASIDSRNANNLMRASYVTYTGLLLNKYGKEALPSFVILLEHLCYSSEGLEKAEIRSARVSLVIGLMSLLPQKPYLNFIKWLLKLSNTTKIQHRHIALEMLFKLLSNHSGEIIDTNTSNCTREKASDITNDEPEENNSTTGNREQSVNVSESNTVQSDHDNYTESGIVETPEVTEEDIDTVLNQRSHTIPHAEVVRAVYERVNDVSSTLRTRALTILTECMNREHEPLKKAITDLNGSGVVGRLMAVAARSVCDERAVVRRAAALLVQRHLTAKNNPLPQSTDLAILVGLCRDASILVRSAAVTALGELIMHRSSDDVIDAFLSGPMHQLSDPEVKVQEQVTTLIRQVLFERLTIFTPNHSEDNLPWSFLSGIAKHNMRRHLQKACTLLLKSSKCINHRVVDLLSTHLGCGDKERDLQCLVLLSSIARHVEYSNVGFLFNYYYKLCENEENGEVRLLSLTLEVVSAWARWASELERAALRDHIVRRLSSATTDDGCRPASIVLATHLDPDNLQWATDLMQLSEKRALEGGPVEEWVRAADLSLVSPTPPSPALLNLYLDALVNPLPEWSEAQTGLCVAGAGRLCVRDREAAAAAARPLAALLQAPVAPLQARLNALLALCDICTRYTCIVEPLMSSICECLQQSSSASLRQATARSLTRLLLAGYLRLRTPLYYRYCALLADEDHDVREPAEYFVTCCLSVDVIYHHFVDCVLHYNMDNAEDISFDARQLIYDVMLQRMSIVQRLNVQCRLARQVLEHAADVTDEGDGDLPPALNAALLDTITLLCGPRMKLPRKPTNTGEVADIDDLQERITTNIVSHKMKRTVAEVLVPAVLRLYTRLRPRGGQVAAYLVRIATDLLNDYRAEIEELIENDEELVDRVRQFQETIGLEPSFGNARNLVTTSASPDPETPRTNRRRPPPRSRQYKEPVKKRALKM